MHLDFTTQYINSIHCTFKQRSEPCGSGDQILVTWMYFDFLGPNNAVHGPWFMVQGILYWILTNNLLQVLCCQIDGGKQTHDCYISSTHTHLQYKLQKIYTTINRMVATILLFPPFLLCIVVSIQFCNCLHASHILDDQLGFTHVYQFILEIFAASMAS